MQSADNLHKKCYEGSEGIRFCCILSCLERAEKNASTNGGDASRVGEICCYYLVEFVFFSFIIPTRDASPPLKLAFGGSVE